jgi:Zn-finger nucleic acid-binding protein
LSKQWAFYWNLCPKCGGDMVERRSNDVNFDVCPQCGGIYLDRDELTFAREYLDPKTVLAALNRKP